MSVQPSNFKNGMCIKYNNKLCTIVEFQHVKPGKGGAFIRTKLKDVATRAVSSSTPSGPTTSSTMCASRPREMEYSWTDGDTFYFMDPVTYEQPEVPAAIIGDNEKWLRRATPASRSTPTASSSTSSLPCSSSSRLPRPSPVSRATPSRAVPSPPCETGAEIKVPLFLEVGDKVKIDTRDGRFVERL